MVQIHPTLQLDAREVVNDPARFADRPSLRRLAWVILMSERGHRVNQLRVAVMQKAAEVQA